MFLTASFAGPLRCLLIRPAIDLGLDKSSDMRHSLTSSSNFFQVLLLPSQVGTPCNSYTDIVKLEEILNKELKTGNELKLFNLHKMNNVLKLHAVDVEIVEDVEKLSVLSVRNVGTNLVLQGLVTLRSGYGYHCGR